MWISKKKFEQKIRIAELNAVMDEQKRRHEHEREKSQEQRLAALESAVKASQTKKILKDCTCGQFHG